MSEYIDKIENKLTKLTKINKNICKKCNKKIACNEIFCFKHKSLENSIKYTDRPTVSIVKHNHAIMTPCCPTCPKYALQNCGEICSDIY